MDLQIGEDLEQQRRLWAFERVGWILLVVALVAAAAGVFGPGLLGTARESSSNGMLSVEYLRFLRVHSPHELRVSVEPQRRGDGRFRIWLESDYLDSVSLERMTPAPETVRAGAERVTIEFAWDEMPGRVPITIEIEPRRELGVLLRVRRLRNRPARRGEQCRFETDDSMQHGGSPFLERLGRVCLKRRPD